VKFGRFRLPYQWNTFTEGYASGAARHKETLHHSEQNFASASLCVIVILRTLTGAYAFFQLFLVLAFALHYMRNDFIVVKRWNGQSLVLSRAATRGGQSGNCPPRNYHKRMYLLGAATSYISLPPPEKISWLRPWFYLY